MAEKNALKSVKLPSFKVICLKLTDVCMVEGRGGEGRGEGAVSLCPPPYKEKIQFHNFQGQYLRSFWNLVSYFNFKALFPVMSMDIPAPTTLYQKLKKPCKGLFKVIRSH